MAGTVEKELRCKPVGSGKEEGACYGWDRGEPGLVFVGSDHPVTTFVVPGKGFNEVGSLFFISLLCLMSMLQYVLFTSPAMVLSPAA